LVSSSGPKRPSTKCDLSCRPQNATLLLLSVRPCVSRYTRRPPPTTPLGARLHGPVLFPELLHACGADASRPPRKNLPSAGAPVRPPPATAWPRNARLRPQGCRYAAAP
ncbi:unnamed protein product, partial [Ectocarpus fasciculatus]